MLNSRGVKSAVPEKPRQMTKLVGKYNVSILSIPIAIVRKIGASHACRLFEKRTFTLLFLPTYIEAKTMSIPPRSCRKVRLSLKKTTPKRALQTSFVLEMIETTLNSLEVRALKVE